MRVCLSCVCVCVYAQVCVCAYVFVLYQHYTILVINYIFILFTGRRLTFSTNVIAPIGMGWTKFVLRLRTESQQYPLELFDLLEKLLTVDPWRRISAKLALEHHFFLLVNT